MVVESKHVHPIVAAQRLGISVDSVYERIRRGQLSAERDGSRWLVLLPNDAATFGTTDTDDARPIAAPAESGAQPRPAGSAIDVDQSADTVPLSVLATVVAGQGQEIVRLRAVVEALSTTLTLPSPARPVEPERDVVAATSVTATLPSAPAVVDHRPLGRRRRQRLVALAAIAGLFLFGSLIQASPARYADDLTVLFIFACGAVVGALASWLALDQHQPELAQAAAASVGSAHPTAGATAPASVESVTDALAAASVDDVARLVDQISELARQKGRKEAQPPQHRPTSSSGSR
jgi:hypothetical protein